MISSAITHKEESPPGEMLRRAGDVPSSFSAADETLDGGGELRRAGEEDGALHRAEDDRNRLAWSEWQILLCWTLLAFLLRFLLLWRIEHVISPDGVVYVSLGRSLIAGNLREGLSAYWPPLYPLLIGFASLFFRDPEFAGQLVSVVAGSLLVIPAHSLIRLWYGRRAALVGAGIVALHPLFIYYSTVLLTESSYTLLFTCGVLAGWKALRSGSGRMHLLAGATVGACYLLKPEAAGFVLLLVVHTLLSGKYFENKRSFKIRARNVLWLGAGFMLLALPYFLYLRQQTGAWMLSGKLAAHLWQGTRWGSSLAPPASTLVPDRWTAFAQLAKALRHEYEVFNLIFPTIFVLLMGLGLFRRRWTAARAWRELYLFSFVAAALVGYAVTLPNIRFIIPLLPILLCWVSKGVIELEGWAAGAPGGFQRAKTFLPRLRKLIVPLVVLGALASLLPLFVYLLRGDKWSDYYGQKLAARWITERGGAPEPVIMSTVPVAAFYAGGRHVQLVDEGQTALVERARREGVAYIIINERNVKSMSLRSLLDEQSQHPGLRLVHSLAVSPGHKILVYTTLAGPDGSARQ